MASEDRKQEKKEWYKFISSPDEPEIPNKDVKFGSIWTGFKERTTAHGVPHIDKARGICKTGFYILATLACLGLLVFQMQYLSFYFFSWKVDVVVKLAHQRELVFPAVTFCNTNPLKLSQVQGHSELSALLMPSTSKRKRRDLNIDYSNADVNENIMEEKNLVSNSLKNKRSKRSTSDSGSNDTNSFLIEEQTMEVLAPMSESEKFGLGHSLEETILDCRYAGSQCHYERFTQFFDPVQGNCFSFNSGWNLTYAIKTSKRAGRRHGLQMVFNLHQEEYVEKLAQGAGMRMVIHPQDRMPFPTDEGVLSTAGQLTSIGIRQVYISRLDGLYGNCVRQVASDFTRNIFEEYYPVKYSANACYKTCYQNYVIERCLCADPQFPTHGIAFGDIDPAICEALNASQSACKDEVTLEYQNNALDCDCPVTCEETAYNFEVSYVEWPSAVNEASVRENLVPDDPYTNTSASLRKNLLKVEVYFQEFNYETMEERPSYKDANYASDMGGLLGLWIGCSVLSIFEFFELFIDVIVFLCYKCCSKCSGIMPRYSRENSDTRDLMNRNSPSGVSMTSLGQSGVAGNHGGTKKTVFVERRIRKFPETPPPPYSKSDDGASVHNNTRMMQYTAHGEAQHTLKYV